MLMATVACLSSHEVLQEHPLSVFESLSNWMSEQVILHPSMHLWPQSGSHSKMVPQHSCVERGSWNAQGRELCCRAARVLSKCVALSGSLWSWRRRCCDSVLCFLQCRCSNGFPSYIHESLCGRRFSANLHAAVYHCADPVTCFAAVPSCIQVAPCSPGKLNSGQSALAEYVYFCSCSYLLAFFTVFLLSAYVVLFSTRLDVPRTCFTILADLHYVFVFPGLC